MAVDPIPKAASLPEFELVPLSARHKAATLQWMNDPRLMPPLNRLRIITAEEHNTWFESLPNRRDLACFAIEDLLTRRHVGNVWLHAIDLGQRSAEVRIMLDPNTHNLGFGSAALSRFRAVTFERFGLRRLYAYVLASNTAAQKSFAKAGFTVEERLPKTRWDGREWVDAYRFEALLP